MSKLVRFDPFRELDALQRQLLGEDFMTPIRSVTFPTTDVYTKDDKELVIESHLPQFENEDIDIHVEDGALVVQAEKHEKEEDKKEVEEKIAEVKKALEGDDTAIIKEKTEKLSEAIQKVGAAMYKDQKPEEPKNDSEQPKEESAEKTEEENKKEDEDEITE